MLMRAKVLKSPLFLLWETVWLPGLKTPATSSSRWEEEGEEDKRQFDFNKIVLFTAESSGFVQWALCVWLLLTTDRMCLAVKWFCIDLPQWIETWVCILHVCVCFLLFIIIIIAVLKVRDKNVTGCAVTGKWSVWCKKIKKHPTLKQNYCQALKADCFQFI